MGWERGLSCGIGERAQLWDGSEGSVVGWERGLSCGRGLARICLYLHHPTTGWLLCMHARYVTIEDLTQTINRTCITSLPLQIADMNTWFPSHLACCTYDCSLCRSHTMSGQRENYMVK